ncbi:hypothetical protein C8Q76DRAFT_4397 [Earliella scabrosa]|nr:hypothetical protein C8Q76DRAFT_4397 [Earliella scabrosa]
MMSSSNGSPQSTSVWIDGGAGPFFIGVTASLAIYGVTLHQTYLYFRTLAAAKDAIQLKLFIVALVLIDTVSVIACMRIFYFALILSHRDPSPSLNTWLPTSLHTQLGIPSEILVLLVQGFYARRVYLFDRSSKIPVLLVVGLIIGNIVASAVFRFGGLDTPHVEGRHLYALIIGMHFVRDLVLTGTLIRLLHRGRSSFRRMNAIVDTLIRDVFVHCFCPDNTSLRLVRPRIPQLQRCAQGARCRHG